MSVIRRRTVYFTLLQRLVGWLTQCVCMCVCVCLVSVAICISWLSLQHAQKTNASSTQTEQLKKTNNSPEPIEHPARAVQRRPIRLTCCEKYSTTRKKTPCVIFHVSSINVFGNIDSCTLRGCDTQLPTSHRVHDGGLPLTS